MPNNIPFNKNCNLVPDTLDERMPGIRRVTRDNTRPFTFKGSYIVDRGKASLATIRRWCLQLAASTESPRKPLPQLAYWRTGCAGGGLPSNRSGDL